MKSAFEAIFITTILLIFFIIGSVVGTILVPILIFAGVAFVIYTIIEEENRF